MSDVVKYISLPLDAEGFFRRKCPLCRMEFKLLLVGSELNDAIQKGVDFFMLEQNDIDHDIENDDHLEDELICPYCGQRSSKTNYWTDEQSSYIKLIIGNYAKQMINENFIRKLKTSFPGSKSDFISLKFEAKELELKDPWISPEVNDMEIYELPCCQRKIKIQDKWSGIFHCPFCGFPHNIEKR